MKKNILWSLLPVALVVLGACGSGKQQSAGGTSDTLALASAPDFSADSAMLYIREQCSFGPRVPNTEAHRACGDYIAARFRSFGAVVTDQYADLKAYDGTMLKARNIIASVNPENADRILICGHWDSRPWADNDPNPDNHRKPVPAANDAASDVAVMLEMARLIQQEPLQVGIDFICFDAEDYGVPQWDDNPEYEHSDSWCLGSTHWAHHPHKEGYTARLGILMDMVGGRGSTFSLEGFSLQFARPVLERVWQVAAQTGYGQYFLYREGGYITDDHVPVNTIAGIPCIDIVPYFTSGPSSFGPTWHTVADTPENIDPEVLKAVGQTVLQFIYNENTEPCVR